MSAIMSKIGLLISGASCLTMLAACGGGGGQASPEAVAKALVAAAQAKDGAKVAALFPTAAQLDAAMQCEAGKGPHERVAKSAAAWSKDVDEAHEAFAEFVSLELRDPELLASGAAKDGCTAKTDIVMQRAKVSFKTKAGGSEGEGMTFVKLGDAGWFLAD